jgi:hypothetical protein
MGGSGVVKFGCDKDELTVFSIVVVAFVLEAIPLVNTCSGDPSVLVETVLLELLVLLLTFRDSSLCFIYRCVSASFFIQANYSLNCF